MVLGSVHMFSDQYLDKEENAKVQDIIFRWLTTDDIVLNPIDADDPEVSMSPSREIQITTCTGHVVFCCIFFVV